MLKRWLCTATLWVCLAGCGIGNVPADPASPGNGRSVSAQGQPALLLTPDATAYAELSEAIARLMEMNQVMLAEDAFTETSVLTLERKAHTDPQGRPLMGRSLEKPVTVELQRLAGECVIVHLATGQRIALPSVRCQAR
ncbi:hypothetical protein [Ferrimonas pelagia]|uniref:Uncharacterized protein n=1 Tax=Ferrimonas pelagia TaxID=1177826 RepID=A0ABP9FD06_9GAMM